MINSDISTAERALFYGDAIFETIRISNGRIPLLKGHYDRLRRSLQLLHFDITKEWDIKHFEAALLDGAPLNSRARYTVWRAPGGLYLPTDHTPHFAVFHTPLDSPAPIWMEQGISLGIAKDVVLHHDAFSGIKALSAPRYVQASIEAKNLGYNDLLLTNTDGHVCEATSSNVFWYKHGQWHTASLKTGCVGGVMRRAVLDYFKANDIVCQQTAISTELFIIVAKEIFLTNAVRGIVPVRSLLSNYDLEQNRTKQLFDHLIGQLFPS